LYTRLALATKSIFGGRQRFFSRHNFVFSTKNWNLFFQEFNSKEQLLPATLHKNLLQIFRFLLIALPGMGLFHQATTNSWPSWYHRSDTFEGVMSWYLTFRLRWSGVAAQQSSRVLKCCEIRIYLIFIHLRNNFSNYHITQCTIGEEMHFMWGQRWRIVEVVSNLSGYRRSSWGSFVAFLTQIYLGRIARVFLRLLVLYSLINQVYV
jgi:hypothetical protein